jgi:hypothetical protein
MLNQPLNYHRGASPPPQLSIEEGFDGAEWRPARSGIAFLSFVLGVVG